MKSSISHILSFITMISLFFLILFIAFEISVNKGIIKYNLNRIDYYNKATDNIKIKVKEYVVNDDVLNKYLEYINKDLIKEDVDKLLNDKKVDHYLDFYKLIEEFDDNPDIDDLYAKNINSIYQKNIFPTKEYNLILKYKQKLDFVPILIMLLSISISLSVLLKYMYKKKTYLDISFLGVFILLSLLFFIRIYLNKFTYGTTYYTSFIKGIIDTNMVIYAIIIGLFIIYLVLSNIIKNKHKKN